MNLRVLFVCVLVAAVLGVNSAPLHAQGAPPPQTPAQGFNATVTGLLQLESGKTSLQMFDLGLAIHNIRGTSDYSANATYQWGRTRVSLDPFIDALIASRLELDAGQDKDFGSHGVLSVKSSYLHDRVLLVSYRFEERAGFGVQFKRGATKLRIIPNVAYINEKKNEFDFDSGSDMGVGVVQDLTVPLNSMWTFTQSFSFRHDVDHREDYVMNGKAGITGSIVAGLSIQLQYEYDHENLVPLAAIKRYQKIGVGLQYTF